jgi:hypothetical protein
LTITSEELERMINQYAGAPARLRTAVAAVPPEALKWRPSDGGFSVHEVVVHCADSETNDASRIRYLVAEKDPVIVGYDSEHWARSLDYENHPLEEALRVVEAVTANTVALLRRLPDDVWRRAGTHTYYGHCTGEDWLRTCSEHVDEHITQIQEIVSEWQTTARP